MARHHWALAADVQMGKWDTGKCSREQRLRWTTWSPGWRHCSSGSWALLVSTCAHQAQDFFCREMDLSHLGAVLCFTPINLTLRSSPPVHGSPKCISCDTVKESCFHRQHLYLCIPVTNCGLPAVYRPHAESRGQNIHKTTESQVKPKGATQLWVRDMPSNLQKSHILGLRLKEHHLLLPQEIEDNQPFPPTPQEWPDY